MVKENNVSNIKNILENENSEIERELVTAYFIIFKMFIS